MEVGDVLLSVEKSIYKFLVCLCESVIDDIAGHLVILRKISVEFESVVLYSSIAVLSYVLDYRGNCLSNLFICLARTL